MPGRTSAQNPQHIAIIMDGNGRWAKLKGKRRSYGHKEGLQTAKRIVRAAAEWHIAFLTLYVFSTENWKRAEKEVSYLMRLIKQHLKKEYDFYREHQIRVLHTGDLKRLPKDVREEIARVTRDTANFLGLTVNLAINYGGRDEIIRAMNRLLEDQETIPYVTEGLLQKYLDHPQVPYPDLIIRTGGERRISNFLLWESAYSELYFSSKLWPDWEEIDLAEAIDHFQNRDRRFGGSL